MAAKAKSRTMIVRLLSTAKTGYFYSIVKPRQSLRLSKMKYDPVVKQHVLFVEQKKKK